MSSLSFALTNATLGVAGNEGKFFSRDGGNGNNSFAQRRAKLRSKLRSRVTLCFVLGSLLAAGCWRKKLKIMRLLVRGGAARSFRAALSRKDSRPAFDPEDSDTQSATKAGRRYFPTSFFLAAAKSFSFSLSTFGYANFRPASASITAAATATRVNHLLSAGMTYQGA